MPDLRIGNRGSNHGVGPLSSDELLCDWTLALTLIAAFNLDMLRFESAWETRLSLRPKKTPDDADIANVRPGRHRSKRKTYANAKLLKD